ncbi:MAG: DUF642 domain-containing protein, partial [Actinobacteria bacterium]|nr:DUF642 domain-containing protein [Actinomycetota bacterium]
GFNFEAKAWNETTKSLTLGNLLKRSTTGAELLTNGGFENSGSFGWTIEGGIDVLSPNDPGWPNRIPAEGNKFIDLNSIVTGRIKQTIQTTPGESYRLSFSHGGNGEWRSAIGQTIADPIKSIQLTVGGEDKGIYSVDTSDPNIPLKSWGWRQTSVDFVATGTSTEISFSSLETGVFGPSLDGVSVKKLGSGNADLTPDRDLSGYRAFVKEGAVWVDTGCQVLQHSVGSAIVQLDRDYLVNGVNGFTGNKQIEFRPTLDFTLTTPSGQSFAVQSSSNNPSLYSKFSVDPFLPTIVNIDALTNATTDATGTTFPIGKSAVRVSLPAGTYDLKPINTASGGLFTATELCTCNAGGKWAFLYDFLTSEQPTPTHVAATTGTMDAGLNYTTPQAALSAAPTQRV